MCNTGYSLYYKSHKGLVFCIPIINSMATRCDSCQYIRECKSGEVTAAILKDITSITRRIFVGKDNRHPYVGVTSSDDYHCVSALEARRSDLGLPFNVMKVVYQSSSTKRASRCKAVKEHLIGKFGLEQISKEETTDKKYQYVFVAILKINYRVDCEQTSDIDNLVQRIRRHIRRESTEKFYIGITSGTDCVTALKGRRSGDSYKTCHGINKMIGLFECSDQKICRSLEKDIITFFESHGKNINRIGGGGGPHGAGPKYFLYLGLNVTL